MAQTGEHLLQRPLYVFDLPEELLTTLTLKHHSTQTIQEDPPQTPLNANEISERSATKDGNPAKATSCNLCGLSFATVADQRNHVRSDLHQYNSKQKIKGLKPVGEADFEKLIGELDESISGSESSESDEDDEQQDGGKPKGSTLSALLKKQAKIAEPEFDEFSSKKKQRGAGKPPLWWFTSPLLPDNMSLGVYRAIFTNAEQEEEAHLVESLRRKQIAPAIPPKVKLDGGVPLPGTDIGPHYFLCMIGGGHFAAMIIALAPKKGKNHAGVDERSATVIASKTFHRYTTRRKQGGSQSTSDAARGAAHSAGSSLRRYNEAALMNEVRELLTSWKTMIDTADLLFIRATGNTSRKTLFDKYEGQVLRFSDPRNRGFPFTTRRATQKELIRSFVELTRVKQSTIDEAALAAMNAPGKEPAAPAPPKPQKPPKISKDDEEAALHTSQIIPIIKRSKIPALLNYLKTNNIPPTFKFVPENYHTPMPLHLAASLNSAPVVTALLTKAGADPTIMSDDARTPFSLAGDRATRDAFRLARSELGESAFDWDVAGVPAPLSKADLEKREAREKSEKAAEDKAEAERRKAETERLRKESEAEDTKRRESRLGKGRFVGVPEKTGAEKREEEVRGLGPEARARMERERRARAAEERLKRMQER
ncbi:ankyrin repeat and zinc finger domain-containing protein 1 [Bimuria novae-zelandiae CBS 107.79]|uniref:Ankyrin repeat and zinc finger domain-containing protein 1 n=1 Tax=Bimuria novae-zelandiae CBS 107.79 TaxID=1447943 RepID=A0A6A5V5L8_9PLEO|nr:ankyrin repeat and zinc finger domain-containing protein 1 [Bimuria novae-zelandiae CBS 107.79]